MKKVLIILAVIVGIVLIYNYVGDDDEADMKGETATFHDVKGNVVIMKSGLRVQMLGIADGSTQVEQFVHNNCAGKTLLMIPDSRDHSEIVSSNDKVRRYLLLPDGSCLNAEILKQYRREVWDANFVQDSLAAFKRYLKDSITEIKDLALYMKQRTFLIQTADGHIGTGFFINENGLAVTNNHVISSNNAVVYLYSEDVNNSEIYDKKRRNIKQIDWTNSKLDITIFSVGLEQEEKVPYFLLKDRPTKQGDDCATYGNPKGLTASFSKGHVSAYRKDERGVNLMQYEMATNGGNSGGPVCTNDGLVVAVHELGDPNAQGLNFGIDILQVRNVLDQLEMRYGGK